MKIYKLPFWNKNWVQWATFEFVTRRILEQVKWKNFKAQNQLKNKLIKIDFLISSSQANSPIIKRHKPIKISNGRTDLEESVLGIHFMVNTQHFINGRIKVRKFYFCNSFVQFIPFYHPLLCYGINWMGKFSFAVIVAEPHFHLS